MFAPWRFTVRGLMRGRERDAVQVVEHGITAVPEPETYALLLAGSGVVGFVARRRRA